MYIHRHANGWADGQMGRKTNIRTRARTYAYEQQTINRLIGVGVRNAGVDQCFAVPGTGIGGGGDLRAAISKLSLRRRDGTG